MPRYVAFLRGINLGKRRIAMSRLKSVVEELGYTEVATFIASGNVLFDANGAAEALETRIEAHLQDALGYEVATFLRTPAEITAVAAHRPFAAEELEAAFGLMIAFLKRPPDEAATARLMSYRRASDDFAIHEREVYWLRRTQQSETNFAGATLERALKMPATVRSITTVRKLAELAGKS